MKLFPFRSKLIVLLYHRIARETSDPWSLCVTPEHFVEHLQVLQNFRRVPLSRLDPSGYPSSAIQKSPLALMTVTPITSESRRLYSDSTIRRRRFSLRQATSARPANTGGMNSSALSLRARLCHHP
jgi:hypothetical protein